MKSRILNFIRDAFVWRKEVELFKDLSNGDYGVRTVWRHKLARADGWREYAQHRESIVINRDRLVELLNEAAAFFPDKKGTVK